MAFATLLPEAMHRRLRLLQHTARQLFQNLSAAERPLFDTQFRIPTGTYGARVERGRQAGTVAAQRSRAPQPGSRTQSVHYVRSGVTLEVDEQQTLLQAGLDANLSLASACRMGLCGTCKVRLLEGQVMMAEPNALADGERERGYCLPCISRPRSAVKLDA